MIALLFITDRRGYEERTLRSIAENCPEFEHVVTVDDADHKLGFDGAIRKGWAQIPPEADFVFHLEDDFLFTAPVPLERMADVLRARPHLAQLALKRQPWNDVEREAGGLVEANPDAFEEHGILGEPTALWTEHRRYFTTNPSLYPRWVTESGWPRGSYSEGRFALSLFEDPEVRSGIWGPKFAPPVVEHIGEKRAGVGY